MLLLPVDVKQKNTFSEEGAYIKLTPTKQAEMEINDIMGGVK